MLGFLSVLLIAAGVFGAVWKWLDHAEKKYGYCR